MFSLNNAKPAMPATAPANGTAGAGDLVKDVSLATFMTDVLEASRTQLIIVDFWATWCGPCKQLTPILEKLVRGLQGAAVLAKIDIDKNPEIAQQMGIQSVPAVFAFFRGQPVDGFMGAQPEAQLKQWLERLVKATGAVAATTGPQNLQLLIDQGNEALAAGDHLAAQALFNDALEAEPHSAPAYAGMLRVLLAVGETDQAEAMLKHAPPEIAKDKIFEPIKTAIDLARQAATAIGGLAAFQQKLAADANDHQARYDLAMAYYAAGQREQAVDEMLELVRRNRSWNEEAARKQLVKFFEAFGHTDPLTIAGRKRLSSILFS